MAVQLIKGIQKTSGRNFLFFGFLFVYGIILIFLCYKLNIWEDESYSLYTSSNNLNTVIKQSYNFEGQPPAYFILLAIWRHINSSIFFARLLSLLFIGFSSFYFYKLVRLVSGIEFSKWILVIFLLNPFTVWAGLEIRVYSLVIFLSTISIYYFLRFYIEQKNKYLYLFLLISLIGLYTQYFIIVEIAALTFSLPFFKEWKKFFILCCYLIPVGILFTPNLFFIFNEVKMIQLENSLSNRINGVLYSPQNLLLGLEMVPINMIINRGIRIIFVLISVYAYFKLYKKQKILFNNYFKRTNMILIAAVLTFLIYLILVPSMGIGFQARYMGIAFPMFILIFSLFKIYNVPISKLIYIGFSVYYIYLLILIYKHPIKRYDYNSAATSLYKNEYPQEPILVYPKILVPPFTYYYNGPNPLLPLPEYTFDQNYYDENISDTIELKQAIKKIYTPTKSYLLVTGKIRHFKNPIYMTEEIFDKCLRANYKITLDTLLTGNQKYNLRIRRLEMK